ncbi:uncharacterized protein FOMMEDRAFT_120503 [Fomitiporia mediterranea MF3/22]|uniref:uncharacterized protein n=1 Tax=Fomitiporia mediterranea (strain MF3/22) TaxID=694068 RepID=UPI00044096C3|nr:uncharacterized protein FOMMEDRAFT_120503 [Fomitiporia mediterranea MF3/22]EJD05224.1 hypothetical protein FOMMEDRAFT_120503 [Fomitiporia mediterranea MF3/22]
MAESLLAILFVTTSAKGSNIVFHWPPYPSCQPRLARPKPQRDAKSLFFDNVWVAATNYDLKSSSSLGEQQAGSVYDDPELDEWDYEWKRPNTYREGARSMSFGDNRRRDVSPSELDYESLLGYPAEFLANILCPKDNMCHQKFELVVDDLAFIGHPVCAEQDGGWRFKRPRGRGTRSSTNDPSPSEHPSPEHEASPRDEPATPALTAASPPHTFHLVFVIDLPDPSSSASGNVFKYFHVIYEQLAFTVTAVLFQEQVLHRFVDTECESLGALRDSAISKCASFDEFIGRALDASSLARAMKTLYEAVKSNSIARLVLNEVGVEIQLPPQLDRLLHAEEENPDFVEHPDPDAVSWGPELSFGWGLPTLAPWKSLLLYDMDEDQNGLKTNLSRPGLSPDDQLLVEGLVHFLDTVSIFDSLTVIAHSLDWNLERQVYPTVRWLVYHRRAKIVDTVHRGLRSVFALSSKVDRPLTELSEEFAKAFPHPAIPPLPKLFALISNPSSTTSSSSAPLSPSSNTRFSSHAIDSTTQIPSSSSSPDFFTCVVRSKDLIPVYQDVVVWLLRRELIVALHLHVRIVATPEIKERVRKRRARAAKRRFEAERGRESRRGGTGMDSQFIHDGFTTETFVARSSRTRRLSSRSATDSSTVVEGGITQSFKQHDAFTNRGRSRLRRVDTEGADNGEYRSHSRLRYSVTEDDDVDNAEEALEDSDEEDIAEDDDVHNEWDNDRADDNHLPSIIPEPGQATPLQRKWIEAMSEGKPDEVARRFRLINQFFDGKRTDDEILYSAEITRKQLREVLQQYDEFLLTALHPA